MKFIVIVGNVGTVYDDSNEVDAHAIFAEYVEQSQTQYGRAANEDVVLYSDDSQDLAIVKEYAGLYSRTGEN